MFTRNDFQIPQIIKCDQFVHEKYTYTNKKGEQKTGQRIIRKQFIKNFNEFKDYLDGKCAVYLLHRFEVSIIISYGHRFWIIRS